MTGGSTSIAANGSAAGGSARHVPVMLDEVLSALRPGSGSVMIDGTFGAGGYSRALTRAGCRVLAMDRDPDAVAAGASVVAESGGQLQLVRGRFSELDSIARENGIESADGVVLDIGVSSMQVDEAGRGFSFMKDGPLDMRMDRAGPSAADVVNRAPRKELTRIIGLLGEEREAARIARAIEARRAELPFSTTLELAGTIEQIPGRRREGRIHPATRTFQALRIFVNRELVELANALFAAERLLRIGGRLVIVTFHSLEDRIVKQFFANRSGRVAGSRHLPRKPAPTATFTQERSGAIKASADEITANARSRSAKMRYGERTGAAAGKADTGIFKLPDLLPLESFGTSGGPA